MTKATRDKPLQARARRTRAALLAAGEALFGREGYTGATAKRIAAEAGVSVGSFYQYFDDKDALLREIGQRRQAEIGDEVMRILDAPESAGDAVDALRLRLSAIIRAALAHHRDDPGLHAVLTERRALDAGLDATTSAGERALVQGIAALLRTWGHAGDAEATAFVMFGLVEGAVHAHVLGEPMVSDARLETALVDAAVRIAAPTFATPVAPRPDPETTP